MGEWDFGYRVNINYPVRNVTGTLEKKCDLEFLIRGKFEITDESVFRQIETEKTHMRFLSENINEIVEKSIRESCGEVLMLRDWGGLGKTLSKSISSTADTYLERLGIRVAVVAVVLYRMANEDEQELHSSEDYSLPGDNQGSADSDKLKYRVILSMMVSGGPKTEEHYPGEKVSLMVSHVTDVNTTVIAGDVNAEFKQMVGGMGMYEFIMPNHDVVVDIKYSGGMVSPQNIADVPMMSMGGAFGGMGMMGMNAVNQGTVPPMMGMAGMTQPAEGRYICEPWDCKCGQKDNRSKFCPNCGGCVGIWRMQITDG